MRVCAHVRLYQVSPNTFTGTGFMEHISRLKICYRGIAYTIKRKHKCFILPYELWRNSVKGLYRNAFLAYSFRSRKQMQNYEEKLDWQKKYFAVSGKRCTFAAFFLRIRTERNEEIPLHRIRAPGCGTWSVGSGGAGVADDAVRAAGIVAVLPLVAPITAMAAGLLDGEIYPWLPASRWHDGDPESRSRRHHDGHGASLRLRLHPRRLRGPNHRACGRSRRGPDGHLLCSKRKK